jgi:hypothetical protein
MMTGANKKIKIFRRVPCSPCNGTGAENGETSICNTCGGDQGYFYEYYIANYGKRHMKLDYYCDIFQNMFSVDWNEIYIQDGRVVNPIIESKPCFVHFSGGSLTTNTGSNIMPVFVEKLLASSENKGTIYRFDEFRQNFNQFYFKRAQK